MKMSTKRQSSQTPDLSTTNTTLVADPAPFFNPVSKWQEHIEVPGLTLFDIHREPRKENPDPSARVRMQLKVLSPEFHCPVCLGYIKNTSIVKECLHRFCSDCIQKCLRTGKKECPQCRVHIPSRRSLRPDKNFDELIKSIYGDLEKLEKYEEDEIAKLNKDKNMNNAYAESRKRGILYQAMQRVSPLIQPESGVIAFEATVIKPKLIFLIEKTVSTNAARDRSRKFTFSFHFCVGIARVTVD
ncbi:hypothetical protein ACHAXS_005052 [Conticribra weissflogii]